MRILIPLLLIVAVCAAEPAQVRAVAEKAGPAVLPLRIVTTLKLAIMGQNRTVDYEGEAVGVVVDADGTTAVSLADLDPTSLFKAMMGGNPMIKMEGELKECVMRRSDGTEVAMTLAIRDQDLGLAILRPREPGQSFAAMTPAGGPRLQIGDRILVVRRAPRHVASTVLVTEVQISGAVGGPQPYAVLGSLQESSGAVCDAEGRLVGLTCAKEAPVPAAKAEGGMDPMMGITAGLEAKNRVPVPIVRSADLVAKLVAQAKAKPATSATAAK